MNRLQLHRANQDLLAEQRRNDALSHAHRELRQRLLLAESYLRQIAEWKSADLNDLKNEARLALKALRK